MTLQTKPGFAKRQALRRRAQCGEKLIVGTLQYASMSICLDVGRRILCHEKSENDIIVASQLRHLWEMATLSAAYLDDRASGPSRPILLQTLF